MSAVRAASRRSGSGSGNHNADIDESLFAGRKTTSRSSFARTAHANGAAGGTSVVSAKLLSQIAANPQTGNTKESVVISNGDLHHMLALTSGRAGFNPGTQLQTAAQQSRGNSTSAQLLTQSMNSPAANTTAAASNGAFSSASSSSLRSPSSSSAPYLSSPAALAKATARKEKMLRLEREVASRPPALTPSEFEEKENRRALLGHARLVMDEEMDDVKHMNQMMLYAQCVTIRDAQILEKQRIADAQIEEEKRMDLAMEVERVRTLKLMEERDAARAEEQRLGASVIITQIQEREQERIRQQEQREQEAQAMLARVQALELAEEQERQAKVLAGRKLLAQVVEANNAGARAKLRKKQEEIDEELRIQAYIRSKDEREARNEAELLRIRNEKEKEIGRLRAMQERAQDRQSAIDELRAKRYQEAKDRAWRQSQIESSAKRDAMKRDISMARESQRSEKSRRIAEQALQERDEYMRVLDWQNAQTAADMARQAAALEQKARNKADIQSQMLAKENEKKEARNRYLGEGEFYSAHNERDRLKLEGIKKEKLKLMAQMGIPVKYQAELAKKKMLVAKIHY